MDQLRDFKSNNSSVIVDKICLSVGTNDMRFMEYNGPNSLKPKLKSLCSLIQELFPYSKIYFQLLIPLPCKHRNDWKTNNYVIFINRMIVNERNFRRFNVLDAFQAFCLRYRDFRHPELRDPRLFSGNNIHPSEGRGMGALAKLYIRAIHSKLFNPFILQ